MTDELNARRLGQGDRGVEISGSQASKATPALGAGQEILKHSVVATLLRHEG